MKIAAMDIFFAVTTVVTIITDVVAAANGKMGGLDVFMFIMQDGWEHGSEPIDAAKKFAFYKCFHDSVFDFGRDNRQSRFGYACAMPLIDVVKFPTNLDFYNFGTDLTGDKACIGGYSQVFANNMRLTLEHARERFFGDNKTNPPRADVSLVSIVVAGNAVKEPVISDNSSDFYADGYLQFIVTLAGTLNDNGSSVPDFRIMPFDGHCSSDFVEKFQRAICRPKVLGNLVNPPECMQMQMPMKMNETCECQDKCQHANIYKPEIKGGDTICQNHFHVTYESCACPTTATTTEMTTHTTSLVSSTDSSSTDTDLIVGVVIGIIIMLIIDGIVVAIVVIKRHRGSEQPIGGGQTSQAPSSAHARLMLAKVQSQKKESQMSKTQSHKTKKTQQQTPKSQMSKSQVPQKTLQMSKTKSSKVKTGKSQMGKGSKMSPK